MPRRTLLLAALALSSRAFAQTMSSDDHAPHGSIFGATVGLPGYDGQAETEYTVVGLNLLEAKLSRLGMDFALGTIPRLVSSQAVVLGARVDAVVPIAVTRDVWLLPVAGGSVVGGIASDGGAGFPGVNAGIGSIIWAGRVGVRTSVTWHHFVDSRGALWLAEIGLVAGR